MATTFAQLLANGDAEFNPVTRKGTFLRSNALKVYSILLVELLGWPLAFAVLVGAIIFLATTPAQFGNALRNEFGAALLAISIALVIRGANERGFAGMSIVLFPFRVYTDSLRFFRVMIASWILLRYPAFSWVIRLTLVALAVGGFVLFWWFMGWMEWVPGDAFSLALLARNAFRGWPIDLGSIAEWVHLIDVWMVFVWSAFLWGLAAVMLFDIWYVFTRRTWRDFGQPVNLHRRVRAPEGANHRVILHVSDLHLTATAATAIAENPNVRPNGEFGELVQKLAADPGSTILVTGDMTDTGAIPEWQVFLAGIKQHGLDSRTAILPGNHDLNVVVPGVEIHSRWGQWKRWFNECGEPLHSRAAELRRIRLLAAMNEIQGDRTQIQKGNGYDLTTLKEYLQGAEQSLCKYATDFTKSENFDLEETWRGAFPMAYRVDDGFYLILFESVRPSRFFLANAIGHVPQRQIARAKSLCAIIKRQCEAKNQDVQFAVALHHHLFLPINVRATSSIEAFKVAGLVLDNAFEMLDFIEWLGSETVVLHGHRHYWNNYNVEGQLLTLASSPSSTLGSENCLFNAPGYLRVHLNVHPMGVSLGDVVPVSA